MHIIFNSHWLHTRHDAVGRPCARDRMRVRLCLESSGGWSVSERTSILNGKYFSSRSLNWIVTLRENSATNMDVCWRCHAASITNSDIFMCVNFQCGARTIWLRARQLPLHATQKIYKKAKEGNWYKKPHENSNPYYWQQPVPSSMHYNFHWFFSTEALRSERRREKSFRGHCMWSHSLRLHRW